MSTPPPHLPVKPKDVAPPASAGYSLARVAGGSERNAAPARWLHTSGIVATRPDGTVPAELAEQAKVIWKTLRALLADVEMVPADVVSITTYVVPRQDLAVVMRARDDFFGDHTPASTLVVVHSLVRPEWRMEVALVAAAP